MAKVKCHKCGHFSLIKTEKGFVKGCSIFSLMDDEELKRDTIAEFTANEAGLQVFSIDTSFVLNKNNNCEYFCEQNSVQKAALAEYNKFYKKWTIKKLFNKLRFWK